LLATGASALGAASFSAFAAQPEVGATIGVTALASALGSEVWSVFRDHVTELSAGSVDAIMSLPASDEKFQNHFLTRMIGEAVSRIILDEANRKGNSIRFRELAAVIADRAMTGWAEFDEDSSEPLTDEQLTELFAMQRVAEVQVTALAPEFWRETLSTLMREVGDSQFLADDQKWHTKHGLPSTLDRVSRALARDLYPTMVNLLVNDAATGGQGFAAMLIKILSRLSETIHAVKADVVRLKKQIAIASMAGKRIEFRLEQLDHKEAKRARQLYQQVQEVNDNLLAMALDIADTKAEVATLSKQAIPRARPSLTIPSLDAFPTTGVARFDFAAAMTSLHGRVDEINRIREFLQVETTSSSGFQWWIWTGPPGSGKSRLADYACQLALEHDYECGFISPESIDRCEEWDVAKPLFLVVDNAALHAPRLAKLLRWAAAAARERRFSPPIRLVLAARAAPRTVDSWLEQILEFGQRQRELTAHYFQSDPSVSPLTIAEVDDSTIWMIMTDVWQRLAFDPPDEPAVLEAFQESRIPHRPLFAMFAAAAIAERGSIAGIAKWNSESLLMDILQDEVKRWRRAGLVEEHLNLIALSTVCGQRANSIRGFLTDDNKSLSDPGETLMVSALGEESLNEWDAIGVIAPDILGELFVRDRLLGNFFQLDKQATAQATQQVVQLAAAAYPDHTARFLRDMLEAIPGEKTQEAVTRATRSLKLPRNRNDRQLMCGWHRLAHVFEILGNDNAAMECFDVAATARRNLEAMAAKYCRGSHRYRKKQYQQARDDFSEFGASRDSTTDLRASALYFDGRACEKLGDTDGALENYAQAMRKTASKWESRMDAAAAMHELCESIGKVSEATRVWKWLQRHAYGDVQEASIWALLQLAERSYSQRDYDNGLTYTEEGLKIATGTPRVHFLYWRGRLLVRLARPEDAIVEFDTAIKLAGESDSEFLTWSWYWKGEVLASLSELDQAATCWRRVIASADAPDRAKAWAYLRTAETCHSQHRLMQSLESLQSGLALPLGDSQVKGLLLKMHREVLADPLVEQGLPDKPAASSRLVDLHTEEGGWGMFYRGESQEEEGMVDAAVLSWRALVDTADADRLARAWGYLRLAANSRKRGQFDDAMEFVDVGRTFASGEVAGHFLQEQIWILDEHATALHEQGLHEQAAMIFGKLVDIATENKTGKERWWSMFYRGDSLKELGRMDEATACWQDAADQQAPSRVRAWAMHRLADVASDNRNEDEVIRLSTALLKEPDVDVSLRRYTLYDLARSYKRQGNYAKACSTFGLLLKVTPAANGDFWGTWGRIRFAESLVAAGDTVAGIEQLNLVITESESEDGRTAAQDRLDGLAKTAEQDAEGTNG